MVSGEFLDVQGVVPIAHRGGMGERTENTFSAFDHATELGYRYLEIDVRATAGGGVNDVYVWHGRGAEILLTRRSLDVSRIRTQDAFADGEMGETRIPRLVDVLEKYPDTKFFIEPKNWPVVEPLAKVIQATKCVGRVSVGSLSHAMTQAIKSEIFRLTAETPYTSMAPRDIGSLVFRGNITPRGEAYDSVHVPARWITQKLIDTAYASGLKVFCGTVNDIDSINRVLNVGVDGLLTDYPTLLKTVLQSRGQWAQVT